MAVSYYDNALLEKIKNWVGDDRIKITGPDETRRLFEYNADAENDKAIQLPLITLRRGRNIEIQSTNKKPMSFDGLTVKRQTEKQSDQLNAIPIGLTYQIDIYCRYFEEADEFVRNFIFNLINFPKIYIEIPYNEANIKHVANLHLEGQVNDNSDIPERLISGQFTRMTIPLVLDDAHLFDYRFRRNYTISYEAEIGLKNQTDFEKI